MIKRLRFSIGLFASAIILLLGWWLLPGMIAAQDGRPALPDLETYEAFLAAHPYTTREPRTREELREIPKKDRPDLAVEQDFLLTIDPATGEVPVERLFEANRIGDALRLEAEARGGGPLITEPWVERGPTNVAGRTRAIVFDPNDPAGTRVWAGGVDGGLWYADDITQINSGWTPVGDFWANIAVTAIAFDPSHSNIMYVGTGEGYFNIDAVRGAGIFRSADGGQTWTHLMTTQNSSFHYVQRLAIHPTSGDVYAATRSGIFRSEDDGASWTLVQGGGATDVEVASDGTIFSATFFGQVYSSATGDSGNWAQLNTGSNGFPSSGISRVELATAPSDASVVYAVAANGSVVQGMYRTDDSGATWTLIPGPSDVEYGTDFSRGQAWYDLSIAVDPNSANTLYVGGINTFRSTDSGATWTQLSHWFGGFGFPEIHADQHYIAFKPGSSEEVLFTHDGGVTYTSDVLAPQPQFLNRITNYNVTQFYAGAMAPESGSNIMLAGSQDNGTQRFFGAGTNSTVEARGGDGGFTFFDQTESIYAISSYVYNTFNLSFSAGTSFPTVLINDTGTGSFINPADYDDRENILYSYRTSTSVYRVLDVTGAHPVSTITISLGGTATHFSVSPFAPTGTSTVFVGTSAGRIFKIENAESTPVISELGNSGGGAISSIEFGETEDRFVVTKSNYGIVSVYETLDGGTSFTSKEGNLPDMPVRWGLYNPLNRNEVLLATESGVWETTNFDDASPSWTPAPGFPTVSTRMLQFRESDGMVMATTHGRGVFTGRFTGYTVANEPNPDQSLPGTHALSAAYPNPFNPQTRFTLAVQQSQPTQIALYDLRGRRISTLHDGQLSAGISHTFEIDGRNLPSGIYVIRAEGEHFRDRLQVTLVK